MWQRGSRLVMGHGLEISGSWLYQTAPLRRFDCTDAVGWGNERERQASCCSPRSSHRAVYQEGEHLKNAGSYSSALHCIISVGPALFCRCSHWFLPSKAAAGPLRPYHVPAAPQSLQHWGFTIFNLKPAPPSLVKPQLLAALLTPGPARRENDDLTAAPELVAIRTSLDTLRPHVSNRLRCRAV